MIGGFYGFTAVTLGLSRLNVVNFVSMLKALDTPTNRIQLVHLKKDFEELFKSLDSVSKGYSTGEGRRAYIKLSRKLYKTEEEKASLEKVLENESFSVSDFQVDRDGNNVKLSPLAKAVLEYLVSPNFTNKIKQFNERLQYSSEESGITVFGSKLHLMLHQSRQSLDARVSRIFKGRFTSRTLKTLEEQVEILESYERDTPVFEDNKIDAAMKKAEDAISSMDADYFNNLFFKDKEVNYSIYDYYDVSLELFALGIVGFTPFLSMCFQEFKSSCSLEDSTDLSIYRGTVLYDFTNDLREVVDSYKAVATRR